MQFSPLAISALASIAFSTPLSPPPTPTPFTYKTISLTFTGAAASYSLSIPADGNTVTITNPLNINLITSPDTDIYDFCNFYFSSGAMRTGTGPRLMSASGGKEIQVGTPQNVVGVDCEPMGSGGQCLPETASCQWCGGGFGGCMVLNCCSGYCAGTKCRRTTNS